MLLCVCMRVRACASAYVRACACVRVLVCMRIRACARARVFMCARVRMPVFSAKRVSHALTTSTKPLANTTLTPFIQTCLQKEADEPVIG